MPNYTVNWAINIDADTPEEAARNARDVQLRPDSIATVFTVAADGRAVAVDLTMGDTTPVSDTTPFAEVMHGMLQAAVDHWGEAVRNDEPIDGGEAVQWLSNFLTAAAPLVEASTPSAEPATPQLRGPS